MITEVKKERLGMVINPNDIKELDKLAIKMEVSRSYLIRQAIKEFLILKKIEECDPLPISGLDHYKKIKKLIKKNGN